MYLFLNFLIGLIVLFVSCKPLSDSKRKIPQRAANGILDLRAWDFEKDGIVNLDGDWEFYWEKFLKAEDFKNCKEVNSCVITTLKVPSVWNAHIINGKEIGGDGYGTYRLRFMIDKSSDLTLKLPNIGTAYQFYLNGILLRDAGEIGVTPDTSIPSNFNQSGIRIPKQESNEYEIIVHVSNFHHKQGGIWYPIRIGTDKDIENLKHKNLFLDFSLAGCLFIMGLYHLGLFSLRRKDSSTLWFGIFCLLVSLRSLLTGEYYFYNFFPSIPYSIGLKLEYLTLYLGVPVFTLFLYRVFPLDIPKILFKAILFFSFLLSLPVIFLPTRIFTQTLQAMQIVVLIAVFHTLYVLTRSIYYGHEGAKAFIIGSLLFTACIVNDILYANQIVYTGYYAPLGLFVFIFSQAFLLSMRFSRSFSQVEELSENLELKVIERTEQLNQALQKSDKLLLNILPEEVAEELKEKGEVTPVHFENASIMFTDFKGFTQIAEGLSPQELIKELDMCFTQFDKITEKFKLEKLKTIGDSYMCAGGIPKPHMDSNFYPGAIAAINSCLAALEIQSFMNQMKTLKQKSNIPYWELRLGIHSGPVMAGVVGEKKFAYDIWGDTVNTASRMESSGTPGKANISYATFELIQDYFDCEFRGEVDAKNKGKVKMYYLNRIKQEYASDRDGFIPNEILWDKIK